jgi:hypothetical protein
MLNIVHLKLKIMPPSLRFQKYNIHALLDKLALRNRGVGHKNILDPGGKPMSYYQILYFVWYTILFS